MRLNKKVAIVTGSGRGLGAGIALKLAQEGAKVVVADISKDSALEMVSKIVKGGGEASAFEVNIADQNQVKKMFDFTIEQYGTVDIIVNNAGINRDAMLHKMTLDQWNQVININLTGTFFCVQYASQLLRAQGSGAIINISSGSWLGNIGQANYAASKAGVVGLTKTASRELAGKGVTCNAICPGFIKTDMTTGVPEKVWDLMISKIPMGRAGSPADVANMVAFLASDEANYVTGEVINVGGGMIV
jgi:3-oxoacyl-[acyl-carrier protein] reductase/2-hydroxycyclohexanecarboxyl-CoA dehydrogenase